MEEEVIQLIQTKILNKNIKKFQSIIILYYQFHHKNIHIYNINIFVYIKNIESYRLFVKNVKNRSRYDFF